MLEALRNTQEEMSEIKNTVTDMKNASDDWSTTDETTAKDRIRELE